MRHRIVVWSTVLLLVTAGAVPGDDTGPTIQIVGAESAPILKQIETGGNDAILALGPGGSMAAIARRHADDRRRSELELLQPSGERQATTLRGIVRELLFTADGATLFAIVHRTQKRGPGDTALHRIDLFSGKAERLLYLPLSAMALEEWPGGLLAVASRDEVRTFHLPQLRSGPVYRIVGNNRALTRVGDHLLLGRDDELVLVDLQARSEREGLPIQARIAVGAPIVQLRSTSGKQPIFARSADNRVMRVESSPLRLSPEGSASALVQIPQQTVRSQPLFARFQPAEPAPGSPPPPTTVDPVERQPPPLSQPTPAKPQPARKAAVTPPPSPDRPAVPSPQPSPATSTAPPRLEPQVRRGGPPAIEGRVVGERAAEVGHVVLLGPNSILREQARVSIGDDGHWSLPGLPPGTYRIQLDAGGSKIVVSEPTWITVEVPESGTVTAPAFRVLRLL